MKNIMGLILATILSLGTPNMTVAQVERSDTIEQQRQKINLLIDGFENQTQYLGPLDKVQTTREDFNYAPGMFFYLPGGLGGYSGNTWNDGIYSVTEEYHPSPYFFWNKTYSGAGTAVWWANAFGFVNISTYIEDVGARGDSILQGSFTRLPWNQNPDEYQIFEINLGVYASAPTTSAVIGAGFISTNIVGSTVPTIREQPRSAFFEITHDGSNMEIRAVCTNNQSPTPDVIFDEHLEAFDRSIIAASSLLTVFDKLKIKLDKDGAKFYIDGVLVTEYIGSNFVTDNTVVDTVYIMPFVYNYVFENGTIGTQVLRIDSMYTETYQER